MANIFQIAEEYISILNELEENDGELTPEIVEALAISKEDSEAKLTAYFYVIKQELADIQTVKDEVSRLKDIETTKENKIKSIKKIVLEALQLFGTDTKSGGKQFKTTMVNMYTGRSKAVEVDDEFYDDDYIKYNTRLSNDEINLLLTVWKDNKYYEVPIIDKKAIKEDILGGVEIEGARVVEKTHLIVR